MDAPNLLRLAVLFGAFMAIGAWETARPRRAPHNLTGQRWLGNLTLYFANSILAGLLFAAPDTTAAGLERSLGISVLHWPADRPVLGFVLGFVLLDFLRYAIHRLSHVVPMLWRFHALHHSDPEIDVSTSFRHHPFEFVLLSALLWGFFVVFGIPPFVAVVYGVVASTLSCVQHGNIRLPASLDRLAQGVLVTTDMHRIHHSVTMNEANANFSVVFSIWDRLFGTYRQLSVAEHDRIEFGLSGFRTAAFQTLTSMVLLPVLMNRVGTRGAPPDSPSLRRIQPSQDR